MSVQSNVNQLISIAGILANKRASSQSKIPTMLTPTQAKATPQPTSDAPEKKPETVAETPLPTLEEKSSQIDKEVVDIPSTGSPYSRREMKRKSKKNKMPRGRMSALVRIQADRKVGGWIEK